MELKPLSPTNDFVFKKVFSGNLAVLQDFLKALLDLPAEEYKSLEVLDPNLDREFIEDKLGVLDVKVTTTAGKVINIEVQVKPQRFIWKRMLFYTSKMVVEQVKSGCQYDQINRVISILIADFVMIKENEVYHNRFRLYDETTGACFPDSIEIHVLELPKIQEADGTQLGNWMRFLKAKTEEDFMAVSQTSPAINEAWGVIKYLSGDEQTRAMAEAREKARMDMDSWLGDARYEGRQEGLQEGRQEGLREGVNSVAKNLLREKLPPETVVKLTGLSLEEVKALSADISQ
ncbi:MAG: Rpn family recombination-promoting nuclease/putative transposase [Syntrophorhabdaceae bacterium]|nr:Rpn family recombination-promoting nuclease/putative transposase [Syntrophorhabdaceae bacterium]